MHKEVTNINPHKHSQQHIHVIFFQRSRSGERKKIYPSNQPGEDSAGPRKIYPTNQPGEDSGPRKIYPTNKPPTRSRSRSRDKKDKKRDKHDRRRSRSRDRSRDRDRSRRERGGSDYADELKRYSDHKKKHKKDRHRYTNDFEYVLLVFSLK